MDKLWLVICLKNLESRKHIKMETLDFCLKCSAAANDVIGDVMFINTDRLWL